MSSGQLEPTDRAPAKRRTVLAWALWDWGSAAQNAVITTFVFGPYIVQGVVGDARPGGLTGNTWVGISTAVAGVFIALIAPISGKRADAGGHRRRNLAVWSGLMLLTMIGLFWVKNEPSYLWLGLLLLAAGNVFSEFAAVSYNSMLPQVSTKATIGRVSGFGWAMGYFGGIFLLLICYVGFISPDVGWFGAGDEGGLRYRAIALMAAAWFGIFALPVLFAVPEAPAAGGVKAGRGIIDSYRQLIRDIVALFKADRHAVYFLLASALYRDGLAAVFSFGAILAVSVYGMASGTVLIFGVVANVAAALGAVAMGRVEDRIGPKRVVLISLAGLVLMACTLLVVALLQPPNITTLFWIFALLMVLWVGPAQASSRSYLARIAPPDREGELFGLYATTGRAASFLAPTLFAVFSGLFGDRIGIVGIILVLVGGAVALLPVRPPRSAPDTDRATGSGHDLQQT
ncbi:MFS transporter [Microlunatus soli]|uniref:MFS transporter, UMF1 family n=1 Tax=Microlunatus soli TaxID=630515 RepID=A0A1H2AAU6_9ACTN|nr:MFS transporter [Microlunatus soli]SDT42862.1 MFS transporter, UMF1 family [Microlunatus soli]